MWRLLVIALALAPGCKRKQVEIRKDNNTKDIGGGQYVVDHLATYSASERSSKDFADLYRAFYQRKAMLHESVMWEAELNLAMEALRLLDAHQSDPPSDMAVALTTSVIPYALELPPPKVGVQEFVREQCRNVPQNRCALVADEYQAPLVIARAWKLSLTKARAAVARCAGCDKEELTKLVVEYEDKGREFVRLADSYRTMGKPGNWPIGRGEKMNWQETPLLVREEKGYRLDGVAIGGALERKLPRAKEGKPLGVKLSGSDTMGQLRRIVSVANKAGYDGVKLQVRARNFPYALRGITVDEKSLKRSRLRSDDTIQTYLVSVQGTEVTAPLHEEHLEVPIPLE